MKMFFLSGLLLVASQYAYGEQELSITAYADSLRSALVSAHNRAFGKQAIFANPLTTTERRDWESAWHAVGTFIMEHGASEQRKLWKGYRNAYDELMLQVDHVFSLIHGGHHNSYNFDVSKTRYFVYSIAFLEESTLQQKKESYFLQERKLVRTMLEHAAVMLITTMQKVAREIGAL